MSGDLENSTSIEGARINVEEGHSLQEWAERFGCTPEQVRQAITQVGSSAEMVKKYVNLRK